MPSRIELQSSARSSISSNGFLSFQERDNDIITGLPDQSVCTPLIPPFRFESVEGNLYRGAYPTLKNFRFLSRLHLHTIVSITPERQTRDLLDFASSSCIRTHHFMVSKYKESVDITKEQICSILRILIDTNNLPLFFHCLDGANVCAIVCACLRKLQMWSHAAINIEFARFVPGGIIIREELKFINQFDGEIMVPAVVPLWLWAGEQNVQHDLIRLRYSNWTEFGSPDMIAATTLVTSSISGDQVSNSSTCSIPEAKANTRNIEESVYRDTKSVYIQKSTIIDRSSSRFSQFDLILAKFRTLNSVSILQLAHDEIKQNLSLNLRSMALESASAIYFGHISMIAYNELDMMGGSTRRVLS